MSMVCAVTFQRHGRLYYADPGGLSLQVGDQVLYPTNDGPEVAEVMWPPQFISEEVGRLPFSSVRRPRRTSSGLR
jgi:cell fate regulator YaaT (PSP1 superfamily)